jgi:hypothetical protein
MNGRVFLPNEPVKRDPRTGVFMPLFDLRPARRYGDLVFLTKGILPRDMSLVSECLWDELRDFNTATDYYMPTGNPVVGAMAIAVISRITMGLFRVLHWDSHTGTYTSVDININVP